MKSKVLTVGQLITALKAFPEDLQVLTEGDESWFYNVSQVGLELVREGRIVEETDFGEEAVVLRRY